MAEPRESDKLREPTEEMLEARQALERHVCMTQKRYLGDAVYAAFDGYHIVLTTEDGIEITNTICLELQVFDALVEYRAALG